MMNDPGGHRPTNRRAIEDLKHREHCCHCSRFLVLTECVTKDSHGRIVKAFRVRIK